MRRTGQWQGVRLYTVGHSTRTVDELVALLRAFDVAVLVDVRTIPRSRHNPQFNGDALRPVLRRRGLRYVHLARLGGLRRAREDSPNTGWHNASFRGFADYMQSDDFAAGLAELRALTSDGAVALMCAEAVPWRCHRSLIADALTVRGARVEHILGPSRASPHRLTPFAEVEGERVTYPEPRAPQGLDVRAPFHLEATVRVLQRRATNPVELWQGERYTRVLPADGGLVLVEVENRGSIDAPDVGFTVVQGDRSAATIDALRRTLRRVLGLDTDPEPLRRLVEARRRLRATGLALRGLRPPRFAGFFEAFANVIPFQQVSLDAGVAIVGRLVERFGESIEHDGRRLHAFPTAATIAGARLDALRRCGLSAPKAESLRRVARAIETGALSEREVARMATDEAVRRLDELPGVGPWSASLVLLRGLGRLDVFPPGDVGAARGLGGLLGLRSEASIQRAIAACGDLRGYLYFLSLGRDLLARGLIHPAPAAPDAAPAGHGHTTATDAAAVHAVS